MTFLSSPLILLPQVSVKKIFIFQVVYEVMFIYNEYVVYVCTYHIKPLEEFGYIFLKDIEAIKKKPWVQVLAPFLWTPKVTL